MDTFPKKIVDQVTRTTRGVSAPAARQSVNFMYEKERMVEACRKLRKGGVPRFTPGDGQLAPHWYYRLPNTKTMIPIPVRF